MMKKTSPFQFQLMVEYMEKHGDLSKPGDGPNGRVAIINRWSRLTELLNADASGDSKTVEKWRKVWSDLKNNTKRKAAKCSRGASGTGGGPALKITLTDLELRVLHMIRPQAATGIGYIPDVGPEKATSAVATEELIPVFLEATEYENEAGPSSQGWSPPQVTITVSPGAADDVLWQPPLSLLETPSTPTRIVASTTAPRPLTPSRPLTPPTPTFTGAAATTAASATTAQTPRRPRRRRLQRNGPASPMRRSRPPTQSEIATQMFANADREWKAFLIEKDNRQHIIDQENLRIRELELRERSQWRETLVSFMNEQAQWRELLRLAIEKLKQ